MKFTVLALALVLGGTVAVADDMKAPLNTGDLKWGPAPPGLPPGAKVAVLSGDPDKDGPYVLRANMPKGYKIPAHHHPSAEYITIISGTLHLGMGDKLDESKGTALKPGGFGAEPANMNHFAWTTVPTVIQVHGQGPFAITYVNPADDPRNKGGAQTSSSGGPPK